MKQYKEQVVKTLEELLEANQLQAAKLLLNDCTELFPDDCEFISVGVILHIIGNDLTAAEMLLEDGLARNPEHFDLRFNYACLMELKGEVAPATAIYRELIKLSSEPAKLVAIQAALARLSHNTIKAQTKLALFAQKGLDSFLGDIAEILSYKYEPRKIFVTNNQEIDKDMAWADICWFEWCDELLIYGSQQELAKQKKLICRIHSYEVFTEYPLKVNWKAVDGVILVAPHIRDILLSSVKALNAAKTVVIPNGINLAKYRFKNCSAGFNIAYVGYINYKKGPMLLLQAIKTLVDYDKRYKLYIAGAFQDQRYVLYFQQMLGEMDLAQNVFFQGWQDNLDDRLEDKNYIICTSVLESQNMSVMQAMARGIKPLIHNFVGCKLIYPAKYVWNSFIEMLSLVKNTEYTSQEYRSFIEGNYAMDTILKTVTNYVADVEMQLDKQSRQESMPVVSICITNYNYEKYLEQAILSVVDQTYKNIELIIVDDCSSDKSIEIIKGYAEKYSYIRVIYNTSNKGYRYGINRFIKEWCQGKYFIILSADDMLGADDTVEKFVQTHEAEEGSYDFIFGDQIIIDEASRLVKEEKLQYFMPEQTVKATFARFGSGVLPLLFAMHRTSFYKDNNYGWEEVNGVANDTLNTLIAIKRGVKYKKLNYPMFKYHQHTGNTTFKLGVRLKDIYGIIEYIINNFTEDYYIGAELLPTEQNRRRQFVLVHLIQYYYSLIIFYCRHYKVYGVWELAISEKEKLMHLTDFKNRLIVK